MSTADRDRIPINEDKLLIPSITKSLLTSLSESTSFATNAKIEQNNFFVIGSYFHRFSQAIEELQTSETPTENTIRVLESLLERADLAKWILEKLQNGADSISENEARTMIEELEVIINRMGEELGIIPPSAFREEKYAETFISSLSESMRKARFEIHEIPSYLEEEHDLYPSSTEAHTENSHVSDMPHILEAITNTSQKNQRRQHRTASNASEKSVTEEESQFQEPAYNSFFCPITKKIMDDPVTITSGVTYERKAITEYFESFHNTEEVICPTTKEKLKSMAMSPNMALRNIIKEWKDRNESGKIKGILAVLTTGGTEVTLVEAVKELQNICLRNPKKLMEVRDIGMIPLLVRLLQLKDRKVRCASFDMLHILAEEDEGKELIGRTQAISATMRMLSSSYQPIRHAALLLLVELSKFRSLTEKMGGVTGGILMLIQTKLHRSTDSFASETADQVLRNMEQCPKNIKLMGEYGYLEPLLRNLVHGSGERKLEMATYLGEIMLEDDNKTYVAEKASPILLQMLQSGNPSSRKAAFKALLQISSYHPNGKILVDSGIVQFMLEEMFKNESTIDSVTEVSGILANILESGAVENLTTIKQGHSISSAYVVFSIINMIRNSIPDELNLNLIRILSCLINSSKSAVPVISAVKESEASYTLIELLKNPGDEIAIAATKLLILLSTHVGHLLVARLCQINGLPEGLIEYPNGPIEITERQALYVSFLATLPHQNLTLNSTLLEKNTVPGILASISEIRGSGARQSTNALLYLEGIVGVLVRFTATLYDPQMLFLAINHNLTEVFTNLVEVSSSDKVLRLAAIGLEKLSSQTVHLSKPPKIKRKKFLNLFYLPNFLLFGSSQKSKTLLCPVHQGVCSKQDTFCLIEAQAVQKLLACLDHPSAEVVEASMAALSTLVDDKVNFEQGVKLLIEMNATQKVLKTVRYHKNDSLWQKAFWLIERFLMKGGQGVVLIVSEDRMFSVSVVTAFHHGDIYTRQMAEKILRYLDKMPSFSATGTFTN